jgi:hypothetical protein
LSAASPRSMSEERRVSEWKTSWSLLKIGINGTYVSVEPFHLFRYLDEQVYRSIIAG